jgi:hypothetical protein
LIVCFLAVLVSLLIIASSTIDSFAQDSQNSAKVTSLLSEYQDIIITLITIIGGGMIASHAVNRWQKNKDVSQIRESLEQFWNRL